MRLGTDGMSSDEEENVNGVKELRSHVLEWRSEELTALMHALDALYRGLRIQKLIGEPQGATTLPRKTGRTISKRQAVKMLPISAYNPTWYGNLSDADKNHFDARDEVVNWNLPPNLLT